MSVGRIPKLLFLLFLFLLPTQFGKHFFFDFSYINGIRVDYLSIAFYITDILVFFLALFKLKEILMELKRYFVEYSFVLTLLIVHLLASPQWIVETYHLIRLFEIWVVYLITRNLKISLKNILAPLALGALFQSILTLAQFFSKSSIQGIFYFFGERYLTVSTPNIAKADFFGQQILRPYGTFSHPNSLGGFYLLLYAFVLSLKPNGQWGRGLVLIRQVLIIFSSILIFISFSKTAIIGYIGLTFVSILIQKRKCIPCIISSLLTALVVGGIFLQAHADPFSLEKRLLLVKHATTIIKDHLLLGTGLGQYLYIQSVFSTPYPYFFLQPVHNVFLLGTMQFGLAIPLLMLTLIWKPLKKIVTKPQILIILFVIGVTGMADHYWITLQQNMLLLGVVFGLLQNNIISANEQ